jgi:hypothetical protein
MHVQHAPSPRLAPSQPYAPARLAAQPRGDGLDAPHGRPSVGPCGLWACLPGLLGARETHAAARVSNVLQMRQQERTPLLALPAPARCDAAPSEHGGHGVHRDYRAYPTVLDYPEAPRHIWALSDVHGDLDRATALLAAGKVIQKDAQGVWRWSAGDASLLFAGDCIDKGPNNLGVIELVMRLEGEAAAAGGRSIVIFGNHEAELAADPKNDKAMGPGGISWELIRDGRDPESVISDKDPMGFWLRRRPFGVRIGNWFFAHGGQTSARSLWGLRRALKDALKTDGFDSLLIRGPNSITRARSWWGADGSRGKLDADLLGVKHIVFGHDPDTIAPQGRIKAFGPERCLVKLDCGMSRGVNYGHGELLHIEQGRASEQASALGRDGRERPLLGARKLD